MKKYSRILGTIAAAVGLTLGATPAAAEYPDQTIHVVVPWAAGGGTDSIGRGFAEALKSVVNVSVVVDNISGAGGLTGSIKVAKGKADGYTLLMNGDSDITAALTFTDAPLSLSDFTYIGAFFESPTWMLSHKDRKLTSLKEFIDRAKASPGKLTLGTGGPTGAQMLMAAAIKGISGADFRIIPYSGGGALKKALLGNQVDAGIIHAPVLLPEVKAGLIKVIGTGLPLDKITYPPVRKTPTLKDSGIPIQVGITRGIYVSKQTPPETVKILRGLVEKAAKSPVFTKFGNNFGFTPVWVSGPEFEKQINDELALFRYIKGKYIK